MLYHRVTPPTSPAPALTGSFSQKSWNSMWLMAMSCAMKSFIQHTEERCHSFPRWSWRLFESLLYLVGMMGSFRGPAASRFSCIFLILTKRTTRCGLSCLSRWLEHTLWSGGANTRKGLIWCLSITGVESVSVSRPRVDILNRWMGRGDQSTWMLLDWGWQFLPPGSSGEDHVSFYFWRICMCKPGVTTVATEF